MNKITSLITGIVFMYSSSAFSQSVEENKIFPEYIYTFQKHVDEEDYTSAAKYISSFIKDGITDERIISDAAFTYVMINEYDNCIDFCKTYIKNDTKAEQFLNDDIGRCYYYKEDYHNALLYLQKYINAKVGEGEGVNFYTLDIFARCLYQTHQYKKAEDNFSWLYDEIIRNENGIQEDLYKYASKYTFLVKSMYDCAYNYFFQGNTERGLFYLQCSAKSGYEPAQLDYITLSNSATFNKLIDDLPTKIKKSFDKYIEEYDVCRDLKSNKTNEFWDSLLSKNIPAQTLFEKIKDNDKKLPGTLQRAINELAEGKLSMDLYLHELHPYTAGDFEESIRMNIFGHQSKPTEVRIYPDKFANAFATPWNHIYIASELIEKYNFNNSMLLAICAHEATHSTCYHSLVDLWEQEKKKKRNNILAGVAVGLNSAANVASGLYAASNGVEIGDDYWESMNLTNISFIEAFKENTEKFKFKYNRGQEIEADINAYRFCEITGIGGYAMIMALELLGHSDGVLKSDKKDDHPTLSYRINLLKYLYEKEHTTKRNQL